MHVRSLTRLFATTLALGLLAGCTGGSTIERIIEDADENPTRSVLAAQLRNLPPLGTEGRYELWVVRPGLSDVSLGQFRIDAQGRAATVSGNLLETTASGVSFRSTTELAGATRAYVSIEPNEDFEARRNGPIVLQGNINGDGGFIDLSGVILAGIGATANVALDQAGAFYILISPSDDSVRTNNETSGIHFVSSGLKNGLLALGIAPPNAPNMDLTELPGTLQYQAWVIQDVNGTLERTGGVDRSDARFLSVGTFRNPRGSSFDSDGLGVLSGPDDLGLAGLGSGWVGSDFVTQGPFGQGENLADGTWFAAISIEPTDDNDPGRPYVILLSRKINASTAGGAGNVYSMANSFQVNPLNFSPPSAVLKLLP